MPSRRFTSGRKFSTTTSAFFTMRRNAASPSFDFRFKVMLRLLRCRFWKSGPSRGPPGASPVTSAGGCSILITFAPQSASWRTQVGPDLTCVRSRTVKRSSAREARGIGIFCTCQAFLMTRQGGARRGRHSPILRALSTEESPAASGVLDRGDDLIPLSLVPAQIGLVVLGAAGIVRLAVQAAPGAHQIVEHVGVEVRPAAALVLGLQVLAFGNELRSARPLRHELNPAGAL